MTIKKMSLSRTLTRKEKTEKIERKKARKRRKAEKKANKKTKSSYNPIPSESYYIIKYIAIICMTIDNLAAVDLFGWSSKVLLVMRIIGRMAMPLFAWELVQCFHFTKDKVKHLISVGMLAVISEIFGDKALRGSWIDWSWQNVCVTFFFGWLMLIFLNADWKKFYNDKMEMKDSWFTRLSAKTSGMGVAGVFIYLTVLSNADYTWRGIGLVLMFEFAQTRKHRKWWELFTISAFVGSANSTSRELMYIYCSCYLCLILMWIAEYKAKKTNYQKRWISKVVLSKPSKLICRYFYPAHLFVLAAMGVIIK